MNIVCLWNKLVDTFCSPNLFNPIKTAICPQERGSDASDVSGVGPHRVRAGPHVHSGGHLTKQNRQLDSHLQAAESRMLGDPAEARKHPHRSHHCRSTLLLWVMDNWRSINPDYRLHHYWTMHARYYTGRMLYSCIPVWLLFHSQLTFGVDVHDLEITINLVDLWRVCSAPPADSRWLSPFWKMHHQLGNQMPCECRRRLDVFRNFLIGFSLLLDDLIKFNCIYSCCKLLFSIRKKFTPRFCLQEQQRQGCWEYVISTTVSQC